MNYLTLAANLPNGDRYIRREERFPEEILHRVVEPRSENELMRHHAKLLDPRVARDLFGIESSELIYHDVAYRVADHLQRSELERSMLLSMVEAMDDRYACHIFTVTPREEHLQWLLGKFGYKPLERQPDQYLREWRPPAGP